MAVKHAIMINGVDGIIATKLDVLDEQKTINVCVGYQFGNKVYDVFPLDLAMRGECKPVYKELPGWQKDTSGIRSVKDIPYQAKNYLDALEKLLGVKMEMLSVGPDRSQVVNLL